VPEPPYTTTLLILACAAGTYMWRGAGVWVADRIDVRSEWFRWLMCIAFALLAGLVSRVIIQPVGELAETLLWHRLTGVGLAIAAFRITRRNQLVGVLIGAAALPLLGLLK
jgi:branched-subunit amino acid transport protein